MVPGDLAIIHLFVTRPPLCYFFRNDFNGGFEGVRVLDSYGRQFTEASSLASLGTS
jgi:hypothetical protein